MSADDQRQLVLTPHPLQRIGAYAFARLGRTNHPDRVTPEQFETVASKMTDHAIDAALEKDTKKTTGPAFWLKCSLSFTPNAPMNHPANGKKDPRTIREAVQRWRQMPAQDAWPAVACVLCGREAVKFFGKLDVPLAESDIYRNSTPRGHDGLALCWPCVCSFYALPYGCQLTGGPAVALHSWDESFLFRTVAWRVEKNRMVLSSGHTSRQPAAREIVALRALRQYEDQLIDGVDLLVFSNNNRGQTLDVYSMDQPLAEWLRRTMTDPERRSAFHALVRAHRTAKVLGVATLARNAFHAPERIVYRCANFLARPAAEHGWIHPATGDLAALTFSYVNEVMAMDDKDLTEIKATAGRVAAVLSKAGSGGELLSFYAQSKDQKRFRSWLQRQAVDWALDPSDGGSGPLVTTRGFELLFDPGGDNQAWFNRQMLLIAVLEQLHDRGWRPPDADQAAKQLRDETGDLPRDEQEQLYDEDEEDQ